MVSNLVPSVAISRPSTVPVTDMFPATLTLSGSIVITLVSVESLRTFSSILPSSEVAVTSVATAETVAYTRSLPSEFFPLKLIIPNASLSAAVVFDLNRLRSGACDATVPNELVIFKLLAFVVPVLRAKPLLPLASVVIVCVVSTLKVVPLNVRPVPPEYVVFVSVALIVPSPAMVILLPAVKAATTLVVVVTSAPSSMLSNLVSSASVNGFVTLNCVPVKVKPVPALYVVLVSVALIVITSLACEIVTFVPPTNETESVPLPLPPATKSKFAPSVTSLD